MAKKSQDNGQGPLRRGRQRSILPNWVVGTAGTYSAQFWSVWDTIGEELLAAKTPEAALNAVRSTRGLVTIPPKADEFGQILFEVIHDPSFPKSRKKSQIRFLAESLGAPGQLTPRRSRDVCAEERAKAKRTHQILRYEYYVECSCGYTGNSVDHACAQCHARIPLPQSDVFAF